jgi:hypothetical protein
MVILPRALVMMLQRKYFAPFMRTRSILENLENLVDAKSLK